MKKSILFFITAFLMTNCGNITNDVSKTNEKVLEVNGKSKILQHHNYFLTSDEMYSYEDAISIISSNFPNYFIEVDSIESLSTEFVINLLETYVSYLGSDLNFRNSYPPYLIYLVPIHSTNTSGTIIFCSDKRISTNILAFLPTTQLKTEDFLDALFFGTNYANYYYANPRSFDEFDSITHQLINDINKRLVDTKNTFNMFVFCVDPNYSGGGFFDPYPNALCVPEIDYQLGPFLSDEGLEEYMYLMDSTDNKSIARTILDILLIKGGNYNLLNEQFNTSLYINNNQFSNYQLEIERLHQFLFPQIIGYPIISPTVIGLSVLEDLGFTYSHISNDSATIINYLEDNETLIYIQTPFCWHLVNGYILENGFDCHDYLYLMYKYNKSPYPIQNFFKYKESDAEILLVQ